MNTKTPSLNRVAFKPSTVDSIRDRIKDLTVLSQETIRDSKLGSAIRSLAVEASEVGYPTFFLLCKTLHSAIEVIEAPVESDPSLSCNATMMEDRLDAISFALHTISDFIDESKHASQSQCDESTDRLKRCFDLSEENVHSPVVAKIRDGSDTNGTRTPQSPAVEKTHEDCNVYRREKLDPMDSCAEEESWTVSQLATLAEDITMGLSPNRCAHRLMQLFRGHRFFHQVDRTCLVLRIADSNQLAVVDSCVSAELQVNKLRKGYSCFANSNGSLFELKPGMVRVFGESNKVLDSFRRQNKPVQRSIAILADSGLASGVCMALGRGSRTQGFLFFNSKRPDLFDKIVDRFTPLFSLFGLVGTVALDTAGGLRSLAKASWFLDEKVPNHAVRFCSKSFEALLQATFDASSPFRAPLKLDSTKIHCDFLYMPRLVLFIIHEYILQTSILRSKIKGMEMSIETDHKFVSFELSIDGESNGKESQATLDALKQFFSDQMNYWPVSFEVENNKLRISISLEPVSGSNPDLEYSIVF